MFVTKLLAINNKRELNYYINMTKIEIPDKVCGIVSKMAFKCGRAGHKIIQLTNPPQKRSYVSLTRAAVISSYELGTYKVSREGEVFSTKR